MNEQSTCKCCKAPYLLLNNCIRNYEKIIGSLISTVEGGSASSIYSVTKISEVDMTLPRKMKRVIRDN